MLESHDKFYSANGKRLVLVVDDEAVNREMLGFILAEHYDVIYAGNGKEALDRMKEYSKVLSLVFLDLMMPEMNGFELMSIIKEDEILRRIPVIVLTSEKGYEVDSLKLGASDFITKPYDKQEVILARVQRTIELSEDTYIIQNTERDELTELYNREFFYRYAEQFDNHHPDTAMDAVAIDINHFHLVNELYGWSYGDALLKKIGERIRECVYKTGGIAGRKDGDQFLFYCPHGTDYAAIHDAILADLTEDEGPAKIRLRMGIYLDVDKSLMMARRFDRAKMAGDTLRNNYTRFLAYYDTSLHDKEFLAEQLIDDMDQALAEKQFQVFYQPKYNVQGDRPVLQSAEALIRWKHPKRGMISPGIFIPLFEKNGLIQKLDRYVWQEAARQVREWKETFGITVPVSVNVSRIDMYAADFIEFLQNLMKDNALSPGEYYLEITESAYTEDSGQIVRTVKTLRELGFPVEMDDFGSGYSSLNMLAELPVDALKLDMKFIRNMNSGEKNVRMLELMIDIAKYLNVPVIAEGVESEDQMLTLKDMGCHVIQGYYFSKPVSSEEFEPFIIERKTYADNR